MLVCVCVCVCVLVPAINTDLVKTSGHNGDQSQVLLSHNITSELLVQVRGGI